MRLSLPTLLALVPMAGLLTGCAMAPMGATSNAATSSLARTITGKAKGGQQPVVGATIAVYTFGTTGYGSMGTLLGTTTTDSNGDFSFSYTCPTPTTQVYALSIGGTNGFGTTPNSAIVEGAALGNCATAEAAPFVMINEITTVMLATAFSHFATIGGSDGTATDFFGAPANAGVQASLARVNTTLIPAVINVQNGYPNSSTANMTIEGSKIITLGNLLAACVNSAGPTSYQCQVLFTDTTPPTGTAPTNVLEAMVDLALYPQPSGNTIDQEFALSYYPANQPVPFSGGLTAYPTDWTIAVGYNNPSLGLGINTRNVTTLDIDTSGRVWFPSNKPGAVGVAYFDPGTLNFSSVYTAPGMVRPEQVAIDGYGNAWVSDIGSSVVAGFPTSSPSTPTTVSLPGTITSSVTVLSSSDVRVGLVETKSTDATLAAINNQSHTAAGPYTYAEILNPNAAYAGFVISSLAGDNIGGFAFDANYTPAPGYSFGFYWTSANNLQFKISQNEAMNQEVFTGTFSNFAVARGSSDNTVQGDGLCLYSTAGLLQHAEPDGRSLRQRHVHRRRSRAVDRRQQDS